jgi:hypothetical protein
MRPGLCILAVIFAILVAPWSPKTSAFGASNCREFTPTGNALGFRERPDSDRCEGLYVADVSKGGVDIVSLTYGTIAFGGAPHPVLRLELDSSPDQLAATTLIGVATCAGAHYRMQAQGPEMPFFLPTAAVIAPAECRAADFGLFATRPSSETAADKTIIPVRFALKDQPDPARSTLQVALLPQSEIQNAEWRVATPGQATARYQPIPGAKTLLPVQPVRFAIPTPASATFGLEVRYDVVRDGEKRERRFDISLK